MPSINIGQIIQLATAIPSIVKNIQKVFGHGQNEEKKQAAIDAATEIVATTEGVTKRDVFNDAGVQALLNEGIELGVTIMKAEHRLLEIQHLVRAAKGTGANQDGL